MGQTTPLVSRRLDRDIAPRAKYGASIAALVVLGTFFAVATLYSYNVVDTGQTVAHFEFPKIKLPAMFDSLKKKKGDAASVADEKDKKSGEWGFNNPFGGDEGDSGETPTCDDGVKNQNEDEIDCCLTPAQKKKQGGSFFRRMQASTRRALTGMHSSVQAKCTSDNVNECTAPAVLDPDAKCNGDPCTVDDFGDDETDCCVDKETLSKKCPCGLNECPDKCPWFAKVAGLPLPNCPSCSNQKLDGKEDGIDCGGNCDPCPTCKDNRKNGDEIEKDCGGSCDPCYTCTDGYKNGGEEDVDCGGEQVPGGGPACDPCPTCSDHIKNGDEDETDCGGPSCDPCYTCSDGLQNGDEEGVDCGGSCDPLCVTA